MMEEYKVILLGKGDGWKEAPTDLEDTEIWGVNNSILAGEVDLVFQIHDLVTPDPMYLKKRHEAVEKANENKVRIVLSAEIEGIDNYEILPLEEMIEEYGSDYFSSSVSYMISYALYKGVTQLDLYGVNMVMNSEYVMEKGSVEYWIGYARGKGMKITVHGKKSEILTCPGGRLYAYKRIQDHIRRRV